MGTSNSKLLVLVLLILLAITVLIVNFLVLIEHFSGDSNYAPAKGQLALIVRNYLQTPQLIAGKLSLCHVDCWRSAGTETTCVCCREWPHWKNAYELLTLSYA